MPAHLARYVEHWRNNQDRRHSEITSGADKLYKALEYTPEVIENHASNQTFVAMLLQDPSLDYDAEET